jgi:hypothetical protein
MDISILSDLDSVDAGRFNALDPGCSALCCHGHTLIRENDGRWRVRYLRCVDDAGELAAVIPLYTSKAESWSDPAYDPATWPFDAAPAALAPSAALLVGGRSDLRSSLHARPDLLASPDLRRVLARVAALAAEEGRGLVLPYLPPASREALTRAGGERISWALLGRAARLRGVTEPDWHARIGSHARATLRKDQRLFDSVPMKVAVRTWPEVEDYACAMFAEHNVGLGSPDHPEIARLRNRELMDCAEVELVVFTCETEHVFAVVAGLVWNGELILHELGLRGDGGERERLAVYLNLSFHESVRYARERGLRDVLLGMKATATKSSRGCVFEDVYGGVLGVADTGQLADLPAGA